MYAIDLSADYEQKLAEVLNIVCANDISALRL